MNSKATCVHQHICVFFCLVCVCVCVRVHLGIHHSVSERHSCPVPSVSVVAGSGWLSRRQTGGGHTAATLIHTEHTLHRDDHTHTVSQPVTDRSGTQIRQRETPLTPSKTLAHTHAHTRRASQRAACQEGEHGRERGEGARTALELCHSHSVNVGAREQSRKQAWTNLLNLACCSAWLSARKLLVGSMLSSRFHGHKRSPPGSSYDVQLFLSRGSWKLALCSL